MIATFHGERVKGKYALFQTKGKNWMIHRMDPPADPDREPMPEGIKPMAAVLSTALPRDDENWAYEIKWDGVRAIAYCEAGVMRLESRTLRDITSSTRSCARWPPSSARPMRSSTARSSPSTRRASRASSASRAA